MIDQQDRAILKDFYIQHIANKNTLAAVSHSRKERLNLKQSSFFVKRSAPVMQAVEFELDIGDRDSLVESLESTWAHGPLAGLARDLIKLGIRFEKLEEKADVSSYVYEMF